MRAPPDSRDAAHAGASSSLAASAAAASAVSSCDAVPSGAAVPCSAPLSTTNPAEPSFATCAELTRRVHASASSKAFEAALDAGKMNRTLTKYHRDCISRGAPQRVLCHIRYAPRRALSLFSSLFASLIQKLLLLLHRLPSSTCHDETLHAHKAQRHFQSFVNKSRSSVVAMHQLPSCIGSECSVTFGHACTQPGCASIHSSISALPRTLFATAS